MKPALLVLLATLPFAAPSTVKPAPAPGARATLSPPPRPAAPPMTAQAGKPGQADKKEPLNVGDLVRRDLALPKLPSPEGPETPELLFGPEEYEETPVLVLMWWSLRDPLCRKAEPKFQKLAKDFAPRGVRFFLVESNYDELVAGIGDPLAKIRKLRKDTKVTVPLLLDRENKIADEFGALCANHVFVIDATRVLRYHGAIDNDPRNERKEREEYLREAIEEALKGTSPEHNLRRAQGRKLKRAPKQSGGTGSPAGKGSPAKKG